MLSIRGFGKRADSSKWVPIPKEGEFWKKTGPVKAKGGDDAVREDRARKMREDQSHWDEKDGVVGGVKEVGEGGRPILEETSIESTNDSRTMVA